MNAFEIDNYQFLTALKEYVEKILDSNPKFDNAEIKNEVIKTFQDYSHTNQVTNVELVSKALKMRQGWNDPMAFDNQVDFYKQIVINNASNSNEPHIVADKALDQLLSNFKNYEYPNLLEISQWAFQNGYVNLVGTIYFTKDEGKTLITKYEIYRLYKKSQNPKQ